MQMPLLLTPEIEAVLAMQPLLLVNTSGGKDSEVIAHEIVTRYGSTHRIEFIYADTGWEYTTKAGKGGWASTLDWNRQRVASRGYDLHIVRNPHRTYLEEVRLRGKFPSPAQRWCTAHHKRAPIQKWITGRPEPLIISIKGMRAEESPARAKMKPWEIDQTLTVKRAKSTGAPRTVWTWLPIHAWPTDYIYTYCAEHNLPLHRVYRFLKRFSCQFCIMENAAGYAAIREHNPEAFATIAALEAETGFTMNPKGTVSQIADSWTARQIEIAEKPTQACFF